MNRRSFFKTAGVATTGALLASQLRAMTSDDAAVTVLEPAHEEPQEPVAANDHIQIALIGAGGDRKSVV